MSPMLLATVLPLSTTAWAASPEDATDAIDRAVTADSSRACLAEAAAGDLESPASYTLTFSFDGDGTGQLASVSATVGAAGPTVDAVSACLADEVVRAPGAAHQAVDRLFIIQPDCGPEGLALSSRDPGATSALHAAPDAFTCVDTCIAAWSESGVLEQLDLALVLSYDQTRRVAAVAPRDADLEPEPAGVVACVEDAMLGRATPVGYQPAEWTLSAWRTVAVSWADDTGTR